jgi:hypothetical protein
MLSWANEPTIAGQPDTHAGWGTWVPGPRVTLRTHAWGTQPLEEHAMPLFLPVCIFVVFNPWLGPLELQGFPSMTNTNYLILNYILYKFVPAVCWKRDVAKL